VQLDTRFFDDIGYRAGGADGYRSGAAHQQSDACLCGFIRWSHHPPMRPLSRRCASYHVVMQRDRPWVPQRSQCGGRGFEPHAVHQPSLMIRCEGCLAVAA